MMKSNVFSSIDYSDYDADYCSDIDANHANVGTCKHDSFFNNYAKLQEMGRFKDTNLRFCCNDHEYVFMDLCKVRNNSDINLEASFNEIHYF